MAPKLSEEVFRLLRDFIYDYCGIFFDGDSKFLLEKRLSGRIEKLRMRDFKEYYYFLRYNKGSGKELNGIIDILTTNETYFFRESQQLKAFSEEILPEIEDNKRKKGEKTLRIWSAGCSTGEEPHTIAILIIESEKFADWDVKIFANDISSSTLNTARDGVYKKSSFRTTNKFYIDKYFREEDGKLKVIDKVRDLVNFSHLNLMDKCRISLLGTMDVIFCRNVIIYFGHEARKSLIESFHGKIEDGGYLLLGHAESLINISTAFKLKHLKNDVVYQKG
ncbi:MAG: protein-glutamate O-methyltransferase CheR [Nitrospinota bacterium]